MPQAPRTQAPRRRVSAAAAGWLLLAPPFVLMGLRSWLDAQQVHQTAQTGFALTAVSAPSGVMELVWPVLAAVALLVVFAFIVFRLGWRRVMPVAAVIWVVLWLAGSAALLQRQLNAQDLQPLPVVDARVLASQVKPPSARGVGGVLLFLQLPGLPAPHRVLIDDAQLSALKPGDTLRLQLARGRWSGRFVTGWQALPGTPGSP